MKPGAAPVLNILEPGSHLAHGMPLLRLGFRPFYLCAAVLATLAVPVWVLVYLGLLGWAPAMSPLLWHAHEMLFGFACAVIVGFLLTAGKAWTGLSTPRGPALGALVLLWLAARIAALLAPYPVYAVLDLLLLPLVAAVLTRLLLRARNTRNLPLAAMLGLLALTNLVFHLAAGGVLDLPAARVLRAALALIVMVECVMAGRVIPGFTMSANPGLRLTSDPRVERATLACTAAGLAWWVLAPPSWPGLVLLALAAGLHLHRQWNWSPAATYKRPILWILHAAYAWIPVGLALLALVGAAVAWSTAFALYLLVYTPWLWRARIDGRDG